MNFQNLPPDDRRVIMAGAAIFFVSLVLAAAFGGAIPGLPGASGGSGPAQVVEKGDYTASGEASENGEMTFDVQPANGTVLSIKATVTWTDEADAGPRFTNMPDEFSVSIKTPYGDTVDGEISTAGSAGASLTVPADAAESALANGTAQTWTVVVRCGNCGDQTPIVSIAGFRARADTGNAFELSVSYTVEPFEEDEG